MTGVSRAVVACLRGHQPTDEQLAAIMHPLEAVAVIAGAGSGKTAVMAARMVWMIEEGRVAPSNILGLTFTNKAAAELEERVLTGLAELDSDFVGAPAVFTYNGFADRIIREHGVRGGIDPDIGLLSLAQSYQLIDAAMSKAEPFVHLESRSLPVNIARVHSLAEDCSNQMLEPEQVIAEEEATIAAEQIDEEYIRVARQRIELLRIVRGYIDEKRKAKRIDFGDQVTQAVAILSQFEDLARDLRGMYSAILLDEYQDTNVAQRRMMQILAPAGSNVTAVGDARQNIYQWRGSTLFNLVDFPKTHFLREGGVPHNYLSLSSNFRSGKRILEVANRVISSVPEARRPGSDLEAIPANGEGSVVTKMLAHQSAEAAFLAQEIRELHGKPASPGRPGTKWSDFAVLVRRKANMPLFLEEMRALDIPVEVVDLTGLLKSPEIVDIVAWLNVVAEPGPTSNRWLARILMGPRFRIHYRDLAVLANWALGVTREMTAAKKERTETTRASSTELEPDEVAFSLVEALQNLDEMPDLSTEARRRLEQARDEIEGLASAPSSSLVGFVQEVLDRSGIAGAVESSSREDANARSALLGRFLDAVSNFSPVEGESTLDTFLAFLEAAEDAEDTLDAGSPADEDSVKLMTIHKAKGLEFEVVFVPEVASGMNRNGEYVYSIMPSIRTTNPQQNVNQIPLSVREDAVHLPSPWHFLSDGQRVPKKAAEFKEELKQRTIEDERRLFYVACTRAKQRLYVTGSYWYDRTESKRGPSLFFSEVAECPESDNLVSEPAPDTNPLLDALVAKAVWPFDPRTSADLDKYGSLVEDLRAGRVSEQEILDSLGSERSRAEELLLENREDLHRLRVPPSVPTDPKRSWKSMSATQAAGLLGGADVVPVQRPLPEAPSDARRVGIEVHRLIEEHVRGIAGFVSEEALDQFAGHVDESTIRSLRDAWEIMGFPDRKMAVVKDTGEVMAELPFVMKVGDRLVRGRIDAVFEEGEGLEIVDFKTGQRPSVLDVDVDQLLIYAAALRRLDPGRGGDVKLTYVYLRDREQASRTLTAVEVEEGLARLREALDASVASV